MSINAPFVLVTQDVGHWAPVQLIETAKLDVFEGIGDKEKHD